MGQAAPLLYRSSCVLAVPSVPSSPTAVQRTWTELAEVVPTESAGVAGFVSSTGGGGGGQPVMAASNAAARRSLVANSGTARGSGMDGSSGRRERDGEEWKGTGRRTARALVSKRARSLRQMGDNPGGMQRVTTDLPGCGGRVKDEPEDFEVEELPAYLPSGQGEHLFLWVE